MNRTAILSPCGTYRFWLTRTWDANKRRLVVCMLNPSTADAAKDDPTILALIHFATLWGYGGLIVVNLFAYRSPSPAAMFAAACDVDVRSTTNSVHWREAMAYAARGDHPVLVAWGNHADADAVRPFLAVAGKFGRDLVCLGTTLSGAPIHPAARGKHRIPRDRQPMKWSPAA